MPCGSPTVLREDIASALASTKWAHVRSRSLLERKVSVKQKRNQFLKALRIESICQPVAGSWTRKGKKGDRKVVQRNPFWDTAPRGAFRKAKRLAGLVTFLATSYRGGKVLHLLERLATIVWRVSLRHLNGIIGSVRAIVAQASKLEAFPQRPEALERFEALTSTPTRKGREYPFARNGKCRLSGCVALRQSTRVEVVRQALYCTECKSPFVRARWFSPPGR